VYEEPIARYQNHLIPDSPIATWRARFSVPPNSPQRNSPAKTGFYGKSLGSPI
jgi:hypothetical protein